jgi:hypothetical protein
MEMMPQTEKENPKMDNHHKIKLNYWNLSWVSSIKFISLKPILILSFPIIPIFLIGSFHKVFQIKYCIYLISPILHV